MDEPSQRKGDGSPAGLAWPKEVIGRTAWSSGRAGNDGPVGDLRRAPMSKEELDDPDRLREGFSASAGSHGLVREEACQPALGSQHELAPLECKETGMRRDGKGRKSGGRRRQVHLFPLRAA